MGKFFYLISILILLALGFVRNTNRIFPQKIQSEAVYGSISLKDWNFSEDGMIPLQGEWEFYWERFLYESDKPSSVPKDILELEKRIISIPSEWQNQEFNGKTLPPFGYASYRLKVLLPPHNKPLGLFMTDASSSYQIFINGKLELNMGKVGKIREESLPFLKYDSILIPPQSSDELEIVIQVSNFENLKAGLWNKPFLGTWKDIEQKKNFSLYLALMTVGSLFIMGIYHLFLFKSRPKERSTLYFGLFCLTIMTRIFSMEERVILDVFPFLSFDFVFRLEHITIYFGLPVFLLFVYTLFPKDIFFPFVFLISLLGGSCTILGLVGPMPYYSYYSLIVMQVCLILSVVYSYYVFILAYIRKRPEAFAMLLGTSVFYILLIHDILYGMGIIRTNHLTPYGVVFFTFIQAAMLSTKFSRAYKLSEKLTEQLLEKTNSLSYINSELVDLKSDLENKVAERTLELEESYKQNYLEMEKVSALEKELVVKKERERIFVDIHDNLGGQLLSLSFLLNSLQADTIVPLESKERLTHMIDEILKSLRGRLLAIEALSSIEKNFLNGFHLFLLRRYSSANRKISFLADENYSESFIEKERYHGLFSVIQEIINNDLKYGEGQSHWKIQVEEEFISFQMQALSQYHNRKKGTGYGQDTILKRTQQLGGIFQDSLKDNEYKAELRVPKSNQIESFIMR